MTYRPGAEIPLTEREIQVVRLLALGLTNKECGRRMEISPLTVRSHIDRISVKLEMETDGVHRGHGHLRSAIVMAAYHRGLIE